MFLTQLIKKIRSSSNPIKIRNPVTQKIM
uniref:Uncharacterized protein n=1 Tax=Anguilla anguilla TaxID=7936 RepID=A0A0E9XZ51_ANGAN